MHFRAKPSGLASLFGALELRVLEVMWQRRQEVAVRDIQADFPRAAYTTLMTTMDRLHRKGVLERRKVGRAFVYRPVSSRAELESGLTRLEVQVNRVTLYRLLDRLVAAGLVTRSVDSQRVSRFAWVGASPENWTPRFECDACHKSFWLADGADKAGAAARDVMRSLEALGHHGVSVDLSVKGTCVECTDPHRASA